MPTDEDLHDYMPEWLTAEEVDCERYGHEPELTAIGETCIHCGLECAEDQT